MSYEENRRLIVKLLISIVFLVSAANFLVSGDYPVYEKWTPNLEDIGSFLFLKFGIPFEVASLLILVAIFGAIHLVRRETA